MKTLTNFLNFLDQDKTATMIYSGSGVENGNPTSQYEVIENEVLKSCDFKGLNISGSLFSLTTFNGVTFKSCVFFGSKIENCEFINCKFEDCNFQFSSISHSKFTGCDFAGCTWDVSPVKKSSFSHTSMDLKASFFLSKEDNQFESCICTEEVDWAGWSMEAPLFENNNQDDLAA